jgi:cysteine desulfurase
MIYLDNAATTPVLPEVKAAMDPHLGEAFGNASSLHAAGRRARKALEDAREGIAACLGADPKGLHFTSCATESNNLALMGTAEALREKGDHVITSAIEHPSVMATCKRLETRGFRVTRLPVDAHGLVDPGEAARAVTPQTILASIMWVNNEVGTAQPIKELRKAFGKVLFHTDAAQAVGKVPVSVASVDLLTVAAHKFHGPKGIGALWVRRGTPIAAQLTGGGQEFELRPGTENVAGIAGMAKAIRIAFGGLEVNARRMETLRARLLAGLQALGGVKVHGPSERRSPHVLCVSIEGVEGEAAVLALDAEGVCVSTGSACASGSHEASPVLRAMGVPPEVIRGSVRFGLSSLTTEGEIEAALAAVRRVVTRLRGLSGP